MSNEEYGGETYQLVSQPNQKHNELLYSNGGTIKEEFHITDLSSADWYLKVMSGYEDEIARIEKQANLMINSIRSKMNGLAYRYKNEFERFMEHQIESGPRKKDGSLKDKNVKMFHGTVQMRTLKESMTVIDKEKAIEFCKSDEVFSGYKVVSTIEVLDMTAYLSLAQAARKESGELVPGIEIKPERQSMSYPGKVTLTPDFRPEPEEEE